MQVKIELDTLKHFASKKEGKHLFTKSQKKNFLVIVEKYGLEFTPQSSAISPKEGDKNLIKIIKQFNEMRSFQPNGYLSITRNSVYVLTLIEDYIASLSQ
jgi:hypothetical protein